MIQRHLTLPADVAAPTLTSLPADNATGVAVGKYHLTFNEMSQLGVVTPHWGRLPTTARYKRCHCGNVSIFAL